MTSSAVGIGRAKLRPRERFQTVAEAERLCERTLPRSLFDAIMHGSGEELTLRSNRRAFDEVLLRPRAAMTYPHYDIGAKILGTDLSLPVIAAPTSMVRLVHPEGELAVTRGVAASATGCTIGWAAGYTIEEIASASTATLWQNVVWRMGREGAGDVADRAARAGYKALVVTIDLAIPSAMAYKVPQVNLRTAFQFAPEVLARPRWLANFIRDGMDTRKAALPRAGVPTRWATPTWEDLRWLRDRWQGGLVIKGILSGADARRAVDVGADAVVVSNHGGKGLDGVPASLRVLPEVIAAINGRAEVLVDGGIRSGLDVIKALALGAKAVLIGRPYLFGLAIGGSAGVHRVFEILRSEIEEALTMVGCPSISELDRSYVYVPPDWFLTPASSGEQLLPAPPLIDPSPGLETGIARQGS